MIETEVDMRKSIGRCNQCLCMGDTVEFAHRLQVMKLCEPCLIKALGLLIKHDTEASKVVTRKKG